MALIARVIGLSLLTALLAAGIGFVVFGGSRETEESAVIVGEAPSVTQRADSARDCTGICLLLGCVGGIVGSIAGAAREIVSRQAHGT
jgi:hypothetical protein